MEAFNAHAFALTLALVGVVIVIAALLSGFIERSNVPQVAVFLALGAMLGPYGLNLLHVTLDSPLLRVVATLSLALVLFTDAVGLNITEARKHSGLALLVLGPGTILSALLIALAGWGLLGLPPAAAAVLGAALASTDPVLLRGFLSRKDIPSTARQALRLESGLNDVVLLPVVLVAMEFMGQAASHTPTEWARLGMELFLLGPGAGVLVGLIGVATLDLVRRRIGVRRDYESIYSIGIAFTAFAAAETVHGSGFLAVFAAGLVISALDVELCDCFLDYGSSTAELALLFTFVLFGLAPLTLLLARRSPESVGLPMDGKREEESVETQHEWSVWDALRSPAFWIIGLASACYAMITSGVGLFNESILAERGFPATTYYNTLVITAMTSLLGNFLGGWLTANRPLIAQHRLMALSMLLLMVALLALTQVRTLSVVMAIAVLMGIAGGFVIVIFFAYWAKAFGRANLGQIQGVAQALTVLASAIGPLLPAQFKTLTGSYAGTFYILALVVGVLGIGAWFVPAPQQQKNIELPI